MDDGFFYIVSDEEDPNKLVFRTMNFYGLIPKDTDEFSREEIIKAGRGGNDVRNENPPYSLTKGNPPAKILLHFVSCSACEHIGIACYAGTNTPSSPEFSRRTELPLQYTP